MPRPPPPPPPRLTHFLALTSSTLPTLPTFTTTLSRFRSLATNPPNPPNSTTSSTTTATSQHIPPAAIRPLGTMHLTLGVMALKDAGEVARAGEVLRGALEAARGAGSAGGKGGLRVKLVGLRTFEGRSSGGRGKGKGGREDGRQGGGDGSRSKREEQGQGEGEGEGEGKLAWEGTTGEEGGGGREAGGTGTGGEGKRKGDYENCRVLWVEPRDADITTTTTTIPEHPPPNLSKLLPLATSLRSSFLAQNLLTLSPKEKDKDLTLHMTVLNAVYASKDKRRNNAGGRGRGGKKDWNNGYDVRALVEEFQDVVWAEDVLFDRVELMRMGEVKGEVGSEREGESWYESVDAVEL